MNVGQPVIMQAANSEAQEPTEDVMDDADVAGLRCEVADGKYEITIYTSCWNSQKGIYYYTTYNRRQITAVNMHKVNLDAQQLVSYAMLDDEEFYEQN